MTRNPCWKIGAGLLWLLVATVARPADATDDGTARLREALRAAMLQLRTAQADLTAAQTSSAALTTENQALKARLDANRRDAQHEQDVSALALASLRKTADRQDRELAQLRQTVATLETNGRAAIDLANQKESERARLSAVQVTLERTIAERETQNRELYRLGLEILQRYEKFSLGEALAAREPFVGTTRTRLENQVQGYEDKLTAQVARP